MQEMYTIKEGLLGELRDMSKDMFGTKREISNQELDNLKDTTVALANICKVIKMESGADQGFSQAGYSNGGYSNSGYSNDGYSNNGYSNARGGQSQSRYGRMMNGRSNHGGYWDRGEEMMYGMRPDMY